MDEIKKVTNVIPKVIPFRCPVCNGFGNLKHGTLTCHACEGKGYILVNNSDRQIDQHGETST